MLLPGKLDAILYTSDAGGFVDKLYVSSYRVSLATASVQARGSYGYHQYVFTAPPSW